MIQDIPKLEIVCLNFLKGMYKSMPLLVTMCSHLNIHSIYLHFHLTNQMLYKENNQAIFKLIVTNDGRIYEKTLTNFSMTLIMQVNHQ